LAGILCPSFPPPQDDRLEDDWFPTEDTRDLEEIERETREREAANKAVVLEMIGDLPEADAKPPPNMLFICKLNPVTTEEVPFPATPSRLYRSITEINLLTKSPLMSQHISCGRKCPLMDSMERLGCSCNCHLASQVRRVAAA
jgi:hypothetical protein